MPTLLEALEEKYGFRAITDDQMNGEQELLVSIFVPKRSPRISVPQVLVLNDCNIDKAGDSEDLKKKCDSVKELDLAQNKLESWNEVFGILLHMPRVEFVNLSLNRLEGPIIQPPPPSSIKTLRSLVLNNTKLEWDSVEKLLNLLPSLEELHLSLNEYTHVLLDTLTHDEKTCEDHNCDEMGSQSENNNNCTCTPPTTPTEGYYRQTSAHQGVRKLHLNGNRFTEWNEICRLGRVFPQLESLVLADCPLQSLAPVAWEEIKENDTPINLPHKHFENLVLLNLSSANIQSWEDIERLAKFPSLKHLRVQNWPLWEKCHCTEHERRQLLIARLPNIEVLNGGGIIGKEEREDAERSFIRYYADKPEGDRPSRYCELVAVHGNLEPLKNVNLRPENKVKVKFTFNGRIEERLVDVHRTVVDLKSRLEKLFRIPSTKMRLFYIDNEYRDIMGPEEMKYPTKRLYSYNIAAGDEIIIEQKK